MTSSLTPAMLRELRSIAFDGNPTDPIDWAHVPEGIWFTARGKVLDALVRRKLIEDTPSGFRLTDAGKALL